jgi:[acyl-carrier-protein] S-malonyltransferase
MTIAWLFPGQGTQHVGMGKAVHDEFASAREIFERADAALGWSLKRLCFEGPESELTLTANAQPAIVTTSIATLVALQQALPELPPPALAAGHSLGEYSALVAAFALTLEDAVRLVHLRGTAMQRAVPEGQGAMAAIMGGDAAAVAALCQEAAALGVVSPANYNAPGQIVIAGEAAAVARASELAASQKLRAVPLKVSAPFHCSLMAPAAREVARALEDIQVSALAFPVVSNVDARPNTSADRVRELLVRQIDSPVLWEQSILGMHQAGVTKALEIGPGKVLSGLVRRIEKRIELESAGDPQSFARVSALLAS